MPKYNLDIFTPLPTSYSLLGLYSSVTLAEVLWSIGKTLNADSSLVDENFLIQFSKTKKSLHEVYSILLQEWEDHCIWLVCNKGSDQNLVNKKPTPLLFVYCQGENAETLMDFLKAELKKAKKVNLVHTIDSSMLVTDSWIQELELLQLEITEKNV